MFLLVMCHARTCCGCVVVLINFLRNDQVLWSDPVLLPVVLMLQKMLLFQRAKRGRRVTRMYQKRNRSQRTCTKKNTTKPFFGTNVQLTCVFFCNNWILCDKMWTNITQDNQKEEQKDQQEDEQKEPEKKRLRVRKDMSPGAKQKIRDEQEERRRKNSRGWHHKFVSKGVA